MISTFCSRNRRHLISFLSLMLCAHLSGSGAKYTYDRFPATIRTEEEEEKRKQILNAASGTFEYSGKHGPR